ncbi:reverse transcriptase domain-containing protein [Tanacetum coccineum]
MPPKKAPMSEVAINRLIAQRVADALAEYETNRNSNPGNVNGDGSYDSGIGSRGPVRTARGSHTKSVLIDNPLKLKRNVMSVRPKTMQEAIELENDLMDQKVHTYADRQTNNKRRLDNNPCDNHDQQTPFKRQNVARAYTVRPGDKQVSILLPWMDYVGIKRLHDDLEVTAAKVCVTAAKLNTARVKLVLLVKIEENIVSSYYCLYIVNAADAIEIETELMGKKINTLAERQAENKKKLDNNNQAQQQSPKKQGVAIADTVGPGEKKEYARTLLLCNKCKFQHNGQCTVKCTNCKRVGHLTRDCRSLATTNNQRNLTCYECRNQGYYRSDYPC